MISTYFHGEMGNNIFQFAATLAHAERMGLETQFMAARNSWVSMTERPLELPTMFDYKYNFVSQVSLPIHEHNDLALIESGDKTFAYTELPAIDNVMLRGYFQSEKYFENIKDKIKNVYFKPSQAVVESLNKKWLSKYDFSNSISIHVRMGGDRPGIQDCFPVCPPEYYSNAVMKIIERDPRLSNIFCFSDNIEWCKANMQSDDIIFVEGNTAVEDMFLMSYCKHNVIGNSSFSWWAAYLNPNENKIVVAPNTWWFGPRLSHLNLKDLFLENWIKL